MAEDKMQNTSSVNPGPLVKGMVKDMDDSYSPEGTWYHARNAMTNSRDGNLGTLANEPSNLLCALVPYTIIGNIHMHKDIWAVFSTDDTNSEIGIFDEGQCIYTPLRNCNGQAMNPANCLNFKRTNLITGVAKENFDCTWQVYWADSGLNPDRTVNTDKPAFIEICRDENNTILPGPPGYVSVGCVTCVCTDQLNCDLLRLNSLVIDPCVSVSRGPNGGSVLNGSYYAVTAYVLNEQRVTDYSMPSNVQSIFEHDNVSGSLLVTINDMDQAHFDYFELVIVRTTNSQTSAKRIGIYSTRQAQISIDNINEALPTVPLELIPLRTPNYEKSDGIFESGQYMIRTGPRAKFDFNYQPLANRITTKWKAVAYPSNYYVKGGNATGHMRDEVYPFFIRWVYNTAEKSSSYHIPGRPARASDLGAASVVNSIELLDPIASYIPQKWEVQNTATVTALPNTIQSDGGILIREGEMGYWESTEKYPDKKPDIFNASAHPFSAITVPPYTGTTAAQYDLCGEPIRHHKFPDNITSPHFRPDPLAPLNQQIVILGVEFDNILPPVDNNGVLIPGIVGYEILRGSREGNKTVIAKGIINNMRTYTLDNGQTGLYQNYPYNPLGADSSLTATENRGENPIFINHPPLTGVSRNQFTFHSPDASFNNPFLSSKELKLYGELHGDVRGNFDESPKHPKEKLITDIAMVVAAFVGIGAAVVALKGRRSDRYTQSLVDKNATHGIEVLAAGTGTGLWGILNPAGLAAVSAAQLTADALYIPATALYTNGPTSEDSVFNLLGLVATGQNISLQTYRGVLETIGHLPLITAPERITETPTSDYANMPQGLQILGGFPIFSHYWTLGTNAALDLITAIIPYTQYAMRYTSHGFLNNYAGVTPAQYRYLLDNSIYLDDGFQEFGQNSNAKINNVNRSKTVALQVRGSVGDPVSAVDNSVQTIGSAINAGLLPSFTNPYTGLNDDFNITNVKKEFTTQAISHYTALKNRMRNQYGQLDGIIQIPGSFCSIDVTAPAAGTVVSPSGIVFNGDTYVGRYTEKNTFFYFWDWLYDQPDGYEFDYKLRYMLNFPRYWADFTKFDAGTFLNEFFNSIIPPNFASLNKMLPSGKHSLDGPFLPGGFGNLFAAIFRVTNRYFYLFQSGVRDFYVESEINTDLRDWEEPIDKRYYDPYRFTDLRALFEPATIKSGNFFKYDQSLSISRIYNNFFSWGNIQQRDYDPLVAETCYTYYKNRMIYSLPQQLEARKDFWRVFLANNYKDFKSRITTVKPVNQTGAMIFFQTESPKMFQGVDELQTELGVKITIGDGGLFRRDPQNIVNADASYEYGSCQDKLSVVNTKYGVFWISQDQGKIFQYANGLNEISKEGLWFWLSTYLPYKLTEDFPNFELTDNPVIGIGCQTIYDNQEDTLYFTKKDWKLKPQFLGQVTYVGADDFLIGALPIKLGNLLYFDDASWTLSYDPKDKYWIGFHDWHPDLTMPGKNEFLSIVHDTITGVGSIWRHNTRTDSFCNFYGIDYPFEIDRIVQTGPTVNTMRSVEYLMEAYIYRQPTEDIYEVLDANFDHATIYNREQVSGTLILNQMPKNSVAQRLLYPIIGPTSIDILCDKVEQKYRFNQFWDITADRGEFTFPNVQRPIWITSINGYVRDLNPANLNYQKNAFERKKFRHYANHVRLYKNISGNINYVVKLVNVKELVSLR